MELKGFQQNRENFLSACVRHIPGRQEVSHSNFRFQIVRYLKLYLFMIPPIIDSDTQISDQRSRLERASNRGHVRVDATDLGIEPTRSELRLRSESVT